MRARCATPTSVLGSAAMKAWVLGALLLAACSSDDGGGGAGGTAGAAGAGGSDAGVDAAAGSAGVDAGNDSGLAEPTPADIQFGAGQPLPSGESILFNDWNPQPNTLHAIRPDGTGESLVFSAYRIWSLGASHDGKTLAFACGDPLQEQHYGVAIGDAIQHTWLFDVATQQASVFAWGNLNDECHAFSANDDAIWVCRRWDFTPEAQYQGYQIAKLPLASGTPEFVTSPTAAQLELHPRPSADGSTLYYTLITISGGKQTRAIMKLALAGGTPEVVRTDATLNELSPDGTRLLFADHTEAGAMHTMTTAGTDVVKVSSHAGTNGVYSPDGTKIAYLWDETQTCHHVEVVAADGSEADTPFKARDCGSAFITELAWISVP